MGKMIGNSSNKKCKKNNNYTGYLNNIQKSLLMGKVDTPENNISKVDRKLDKSKVRTSSIKSS